MGQICTLLASKSQYKIFFLEKLYYLFLNLNDTLTSCKKNWKISAKKKNRKSDIKKQFIRDNLIYQSDEFLNNFKYSTIQPFGRNTGNREIMINEVDDIHEELREYQQQF